MTVPFQSPVPSRSGTTSKTTTTREYDEKGRVVKETVTTETVTAPQQVWPTGPFYTTSHTGSIRHTFDQSQGDPTGLRSRIRSVSAS